MAFTLPILYHSPTHRIGSDLQRIELGIYFAIKREIDRIKVESERSKKVILDVCKKFIQADIDLGECFYTDRGQVVGGSYAVLKCVVKYLRHLLIDTSIAAVYLRLICLIDALIRRGGFTAHWLIGQKRFLQTISLTGRRWARPVQIATDPYAREASDVAMDCILVWHEGFYPVRSIFPYYSQTYYKLKRKYHIIFMRPENDPGRAPIAFERCDPSLLEEQDFLFNESIDTTEHAYSDAHVSYSVYNHLYDTSSFIGAPKEGEDEEEVQGGGPGTFMIDDGTINTYETKEVETLPPFQYANPKNETMRKSVSIDEKPQYFGEEDNHEKKISPEISPLSTRPKSFQFQSNGTSFRVEEDPKNKDGEQDEDDEEEEEKKKRAVLDKRERMIDEDRAFEIGDDDSEADSSPNKHRTPSKSNVTQTELQPDSTPFRGDESVYSVDDNHSIRSGTVGERVQMFNSTDSGGSRRSISNRSIGSTEKNVEIKFFGTQRVVVKRDSLPSH